MRQPWAHALVVGAKRIETRSWQTHYRGPLAIHAARGFTAAEQDFARKLGFVPGELPRGAIVAVTSVVKCLPTDALELKQRLTEAERTLGNFDPGRWGWVLGDVHPLREPLVCTGALSLWEHDTTAIEARL